MASNACGPYVVTLLKRMSRFEWCMKRLVVKNINLIERSWDRIKVYAKYRYIVLASKVTAIERA